MNDQKDIFDKIMHLPGLRVFEGFFQKHREGLMYLFFGGMTTLVNLALSAFFWYLLHWESWYLGDFAIGTFLGNLISIVAAILFAYVTNKLIVFRSHCSSLGELAAECGRFIGARLATMVIEVGGVYVLYNIIHQNELIAKLETQVLVVIGNYFISRFIVFRGREKSNKE
jgi:putative flippase GtrA